MRNATGIPSRPERPGGQSPSFVHHDSFHEPDAAERYGGPPEPSDESLGFMPDGATRDRAKRMHYAAWRARTATTRREADRWHRRHLACRDMILLGNRKLVFRAVHKWHSSAQHADDMTSECQIVLIKAVAAFNPWMGIRFSTYAFTCLLRALSRLSRRQDADRLTHSLSLESLRDRVPCSAALDAKSTAPEMGDVEDYLRDEHPLLTPREKTVLIRRFHLRDEGSKTETLKQVGRELGLSKERVRQVQVTALGKLREALLAG